jgi:hypothetical protein
MAEKLRSQGASKSNVQTAARSKAQADSSPAGKGSERRGVYINERGETCYGDDCVTLAVDQERNEIRVNIKSSAKCDVNLLVDSLRDAIGTGSRTVYEVESELQEARQRQE